MWTEEVLHTQCGLKKHFYCKLTLAISSSIEAVHTTTTKVKAKNMPCHGFLCLFFRAHKVKTKEQIKAEIFYVSMKKNDIRRDITKALHVFRRNSFFNNHSFFHDMGSHWEVCKCHHCWKKWKKKVKRKCVIFWCGQAEVGKMFSWLFSEKHYLLGCWIQKRSENTRKASLFFLSLSCLVSIW